MKALVGPLFCLLLSTGCRSATDSTIFLGLAACKILAIPSKSLLALDGNTVTQEAP
jgi:hypothetical protein